MTVPRDKRKSPRKSVDLRAAVEVRSGNAIVVGDGRLRLEVLLQDTSPAGFRFIVPGQDAAAAIESGFVQRGAMLTLQLELLPSKTKLAIVGTIAWVSDPAGPGQPMSIGVRAMPELADGATRRAFARWVAVAS